MISLHDSARAAFYLAEMQHASARIEFIAAEAFRDTIEFEKWRMDHSATEGYLCVEYEAAKAKAYEILFPK